MNEYSHPPSGAGYLDDGLNQSLISIACPEFEYNGSLLDDHEGG